MTGKGINNDSLRIFLKRIGPKINTHQYHNTLLKTVPQNKNSNWVQWLLLVKMYNQKTAGVTYENLKLFKDIIDSNIDAYREIQH